MHPNAPAPAPPPAPMPSGNHNPYEFIMGGQKPKRGLGGGSMKQRLLIAVGGASILIVLLLVLVAFVSGGGSSSTDTLVKLAQQQNEIARVAGLAKDKDATGSTKNLAITAQLSIQSAQADTVALLKKEHHNVKAKQLALLQNSNTDQQLTAASSAGTFNATFTQVLQSELTSYQVALQNAYRNSTSTSEKQLLQDNFNSVNYLLGTPKS